MPLSDAVVWWEVSRAIARDPAEERRLNYLMELDALRAAEQTSPRRYRVAQWLGDRLVNAGERLRSWSAPSSAPPAIS
jgi:hypothetical protein